MRRLIPAAFRPRHVSLRKLLLAWVLLPQLALWLGGGFATYRLTVKYVNQVADTTLLQATRALSRQVKPVGSGLVVDFPKAAQAVLEADPTDRLSYMVSMPPGRFILGNQELPAPPAAMTPRADLPYFYDGEIARQALPGGGEGVQRVRIAALYLHNGRAEGEPRWMLVQVARGMSNRESLLQNILVDTLLPLSGLMLVLTMLVWAGINAGLAPLNRLRSEVEGRSPLNLSPLQVDAAPDEVRALVAALNELLASMQQSSQAQQRFIADAAHQLRTPLAGLTSQTEIALRSSADPALSARLQLVHRSALRSAHLVNQLLMLARAEPDALPGQDTVRTDLRVLVPELVADMVPAALRTGVDLGFDEAEASAEGVEVMANPSLLREAVSNLIDNAIAYAGRGSEATVGIGRADGRALIVVSDNGPGIPPQMQEAVFDRFVRATDSGAGCGLGLAIVREIVARHGGSVALENLSPQGLKVTVSLPLVQAA